MIFEFTPYSLICLLAACVGAVVAAVVWQRRRTPGGTALALLMIAVTEWTLGAALEYATVGIPG